MKDAFRSGGCAPLWAPRRTPAQDRRHCPSCLDAPTRSDGQGISRDDMARMERELANLQAQVRSFEESFGVGARHLTVARGYLRKSRAIRGSPVGSSKIAGSCEADGMPGEALPREVCLVGIEQNIRLALSLLGALLVARRAAGAGHGPAIAAHEAAAAAQGRAARESGVSAAPVGTLAIRRRGRRFRSCRRGG